MRLNALMESEVSKVSFFEKPNKDLIKGSLPKFQIVTESENLIPIPEITPLITITHEEYVRLLDSYARMQAITNYIEMRDGDTEKAFGKRSTCADATIRVLVLKH